jgi:hypothetical protein
MIDHTTWEQLTHSQKEIDMNSYSEPPQSMRSGNVEDFEVWVFDANDLVISVIPIHAPWNASSEKYYVENSPT